MAQIDDLHLCGRLSAKYGHRMDTKSERQFPPELISPNALSEINTRLQQAEHAHGVTILMAVESGSRAWGFHSPDSDYDARFIYAHPSEWYLSIEDRRDVIEYPIVDLIDINGWDLRKALRLFAKSNPAFLEWLNSPIRYLDQLGFAEKMQALAPDVYEPASGIYHYRSAAATTYRQYLSGDEVSLKKYFYALRPLLALRYVERERTVPPMMLQELMAQDRLAAPVRADIDQLIELKRTATERATATPLLHLHRFIEHELDRVSTLKIERPDGIRSHAMLDGVFCDLLRKVDSLHQR